MTSGKDADTMPDPSGSVDSTMLGSSDGFRQAMLKTAIETIPQLSEENFSIWRDKVVALLKLRGVLNALESASIPLGETINAELVMLLLSKMDSVTHNNVVTAENRDSAQKLWLSIKERFASSQSSNRAKIFNDFLYLKFHEDAVGTFVTDIKVAIKKLVDVGIDLPQDILAYLVLFKFPNSLQTLKHQIMHSDKDLDVQFVCNHLIQFDNENKVESTKMNSGPIDAALFTSKGKGNGFRGSDRTKHFNFGSRRCKSGFHNPKQDENHSSDDCWHLHPDKAPEWWRDSQAQWKANKEKENYFISLLTLWVESGNPRCRIILDSGASTHIFNDEKYFTDLELGEFDSIKTGKKDATLPIKGRGTVRLTWGNRTLQLENCLFVPDIVINLISAGELSLKNCEIQAKGATFTVSKDNGQVLKGRIDNGLFTVNNPTEVGGGKRHSANVLQTKESLQEIHERLGHASIQRIEPLVDKLIPKSEIRNFECKSCVLAKITKQSFKNQSTTVAKPFERLHLDLIGPINPQSSLRHRYILTVVDNHSGYLAGFPLKRRGYFPTTVCSDGGGEFLGNRLARFFNEHNIQRLISEPYHPEHNGRAERANRTIVESMRATIDSSGIQKRYWHEILKSCCLALNQIPKKGRHDSPWEILHGKPLKKGFLKPIGTPAIALRMVKTQGRKLDPKGEEGILIGFNVPFHSYRLLMRSGKTIDTKHVRFLQKRNEIRQNASSWDEDEIPLRNMPLRNPQEEASSEDVLPTNTHAESHLDHGEVNGDRDEPTDSSDEESTVQQQLIQEQTPQSTSTRTLRDRTQLRPPIRPKILEKVYRERSGFNRRS
ncbi:hypothetical protein VP01_2933g1 [Puccinia sorghi]|uniref:Integrase catalytic domain-containing protein n=1 Tax=Puccinia sorghi TaxID=27349 RepID=A0A0L6V1X2_9BASI|nr:hypothetical protein VP01_2933g1 [Puccinia sorghi]